jgi:hypothetical protein
MEVSAYDVDKSCDLRSGLHHTWTDLSPAVRVGRDGDLETTFYSRLFGSQTLKYLLFQRLVWGFGQGGRSAGLFVSQFGYSKNTFF